MKPEIELKRFDEWEECDCNECEQWWTSRCDGSKVGKAKECKSYIATRRIDIPQQLDELTERVNELTKYHNRVAILTSIQMILWLITLIILFAR